MSIESDRIGEFKKKASDIADEIISLVDHVKSLANSDKISAHVKSSLLNVAKNLGYYSDYMGDSSNDLMAIEDDAYADSNVSTPDKPIDYMYEP